MTRQLALAVDDFKPAELVRQIESAGVAKARLTATQTLTLAVLAGAFIGFGAAFYMIVMTGTEAGFGPARFLGGLAFCLGLILVVVAGAELFTGNALMTIAAVDGRITRADLLRNWSLVYVGNAVGAVGLALLFWAAGSFDGAAGATAAGIAESKVAIGPGQAFFRGILCNILVCLAVWLSSASRSVTGKIFAILFPISAFVALGLEHSVANFFFLPMGALAGGTVPLGGAVQNLLFVTLGNIIGGAGGVALAYRCIWGSPDADAG